MNSYCSRSACNQMVAEVGDGRRRRLPGAVVVWNGGRLAVVMPAVGGGCRWRSKKKEGEENLQERERDRQCMLCSWWGVKATVGSGDGEGLTWGRWLRLWQRWWLVAKEAKEEEENGRGCREERETDGGSWWSVGGYVGFLWWSWWWEDRWWVWWWLKTRWREKEKRGKQREWQKPGRGWFFGLFWTRFSPPSSHNISLYL